MISQPPWAPPRWSFRRIHGNGVLRAKGLLDVPKVDDLKLLHALRRDLIGLRRGIAPVRDVVLGLMREPESEETITEETRLFLCDCYDHVIRTTDQIDTFRELCASLMDLYLSTVSNRTNDVTKVLTMIATVFIPLSFLVGLYGMNFDTASPWNMPELGARFGYPILVAVMILVVGGFLAFFKKKGWLFVRPLAVYPVYPGSSGAEAAFLLPPWVAQ